MGSRQVWCSTWPLEHTLCCSRPAFGVGLLPHQRRPAPLTLLSLHTHTPLPCQVDRDLRLMLLRPDAPPPQKVAVRIWPRAIPQFNVGHLDAIQVRRGLPRGGS